MMTTNDESAQPAKKRSERTCAGCSKHAPADELVRVVHDPSSGEVAVDLAGSGFGRGAHVHPTPECIAKALKGGLARVFKAKVVGDAAAIGAAIVSAADRRIEGLLSGARRAGQLAVGSDVASRALKEEKAHLVVVARDAAAATKIPEIERAIASGKAIAFGEKQRLGSLLGGTVAEPKEVAVIAILHKGVAAAVEITYRMSGPFRSTGARAGAADALAPAKADERRSEEAWSSPSEVR
jgi:predicted RNA-binding protein YlxR (DUF448 family)/ribosomal protein L7Ae-like RNA K-turn-binding protein